VLSSGPDLADVDGDGLLDLVLSVFAGSLKGEIQRRLTGKVRLSYYVYLGSGKNPPFPRSPDLTIEDVVSTEVFEAWDLRHRCLLDRDWTKDGLSDLVRLEGDDEGVSVTVHTGSKASGRLAFNAGPAFSHRYVGPVLGYRTVSLMTGRPAVQLLTPAGASFITLSQH
jgi:hypothetical protein